MSEIGNTHAAAAQERIAFRIGGQEFCVDVMSVREIRGWTPETAMPRSPDFVRGVISLRGTVLPIVDMALRLGFRSAEPTARHAIVVAQINQQIVGLLVDGVSEILTVKQEHIQPAPDVASDAARSFVDGVIVMEDRLITSIALDHLLPPLELAAA